MADETTEAERILGEDEIASCIEKLTGEILAGCPEGRKLALVGIHSTGVTLAERIGKRLSELGGSALMGTLDISLYRDDLRELDEMPSLRASDIPFEIDGSHIVLVDDVLYTGRTIRAALNGIMDYGRPAKIELAVLVDRGNRELPIAPDHVGITLETEKGDYVRVRLIGSGDDAEDAVILRKKGGSA